LSASARAATSDELDDRARVDARDKRIATVRARAALAGWRVELVPEGFECWRWSRCRCFESLDLVEAFVDTVTA